VVHDRRAQQPYRRIDEPGHPDELFCDSVIRFACRQQPFDIGVGDSRRQRSVALDLGLAEVGAGGESPRHPDRLRRHTEVSPRQIVLAKNPANTAAGGFTARHDEASRS